MAEEKPVLIEQTAKKWKKIQAAGMALVVIAAVLGVFAMRSQSEPLILSGLATFVAGIVVYYVGDLAWWHHGRPMRAIIPARQEPRPLPEPLAAAAATNAGDPAIDAVDELAVGGEAATEAGDVGGGVGGGGSDVEDGGQGARRVCSNLEWRPRSLRHPVSATPRERRCGEFGFRPLAATRSLALPDASVGVALPVAVHAAASIRAKPVSLPSKHAPTEYGGLAQ